jgi:heme-degrading monooxygenase HmoA
MVLETASLWIKPGEQAAFEQAFAKAQRLLAGMEGYISHELQQSLEHTHFYMLLIEWRALEDHTLRFCKSNELLRWRELLHGFMAEPPQIEHFRQVQLPR